MFGVEFSGRDEEGNRVIGILPCGALSTHVRRSSHYLWKFPSEWSMSEAATVPNVYSTAYYALVVRGNVQSGETVLIHSGAGGVGQAAIAVALSYRCRVFTTVSSQRKRDYLKKRFHPHLSDSSFAYSRDASFEGHVMNETDGKGVDVVLNSLSGELLKASLRCVRQDGRFLEIGKVDFVRNSQLGMSMFLKNISFHGISVDSLLDENSTPQVWHEVWRLVDEGMKQRVVTPLEASVYKKSDVESAFRYFATGFHIGKIMIEMEDEMNDVVHSTRCDPDVTYVITGGLGAFGLEVCGWLVERGARRIVITTSSGIRTAHQRVRIDDWRRKGVDVEVSDCDVRKLDQAERLLDENVGGIFHLAVRMNDRLFDNLTPESFQVPYEAKVIGTTNLDVVSRRKCPKLRWFCAFSSAVVKAGNVGQTSYAFANSSMERICALRRRAGFPACAIQWGVVGEVGLGMEAGKGKAIAGSAPQSMESCLNVLDKYLSTEYDDSVVASYIPVPKLSNDAKRASSQQKSIPGIIAHIVGIQDWNAVDPEAPLLSLGMDSLMTTEIAQLLARQCDVTVDAKEVQNLTFNKISQFKIVL